MKFILALLAALFIVPSLAPTSAEAKRGFKFGSAKVSKSKAFRRTGAAATLRPSNDDNRNVVLVRELPDIAAYKKTSLFYDLGWKHSFPRGGEWVGYLPAPAYGYVALDQAEVVSELLPSLGLTQADVPPRRSFFDGLSTLTMWLLIICLSLVALGTIIALVRSFGAEPDEDAQVALAR